MKYQRIPEKVNVEIYHEGWSMEDGFSCTRHRTICGQMDLKPEDGAKLVDKDCAQCVKTQVFCANPFVWTNGIQDREPVASGSIVVTKEDGTKEVYNSKQEFDKLYEKAD